MKSSSEEWIELAVRESFKTKRARIENGLEEDETWTFAVVAIEQYEMTGMELVLMSRGTGNGFAGCVVQR